MNTQQQVSVLGAGAWGTAFATLLAWNGFRVKLWSFESQGRSQDGHDYGFVVEDGFGEIIQRCHPLTYI